MIGGYMKKITKKDLLILLTMWLSPAVILLLIVSIYLIQPKVEAKLVSNVRSVLVANNIDAEVSFSGRDGRLSGEVDSQEIADNAQRLSLTVFGIRIMRNQLLVRKPYITPEIYNEPQPPVFKKVSYKIDFHQEAGQIISEEFEIESEKEKPHYNSDMERIMLAMQQKVEPVMQPLSRKIVSITIPLEKGLAEHEEDNVLESAITHSKPIKPRDKQAKHQLNKSTDNLFNIIDDFNTSLGFLADNHAKDQKEVGLQKEFASQSIDKIDLSSIQFSNSSTSLPVEAHQVLDKVATSIKIQSYPAIELIAYANDSDIAYARGVAIREYLAVKGINKNSVHVSGHTISDSNRIDFEIRPYIH